MGAWLQGQAEESPPAPQVSQGGNSEKAMTVLIIIFSRGHPSESAKQQQKTLLLQLLEDHMLTSEAKEENVCSNCQLVTPGTCVN